MDVGYKTAAAAAAAAAVSNSVGMNESASVHSALQQLLSYASMPQHGSRTVLHCPQLLSAAVRLSCPADVDLSIICAFARMREILNVSMSGRCRVGADPLVVCLGQKRCWQLPSPAAVRQQQRPCSCSPGQCITAEIITWLHERPQWVLPPLPGAQCPSCTAHSPCAARQSLCHSTPCGAPQLFQLCTTHTRDSQVTQQAQLEVGTLLHPWHMTNVLYHTSPPTVSHVSDIVCRNSKHVCLFLLLFLPSLLPLLSPHCAVVSLLLLSWVRCPPMTFQMTWSQQWLRHWQAARWWQ